MQHQDLVKSDTESIQRIVSESQTPIERISAQEIKIAFRKLKANKAVDVMNLTSEYFKYGGQCPVSYMLHLMNYSVALS